MQMTNFTVAGNRFEVVARLHNGDPVYDLYLASGIDAELISGASYGEFIRAIREMEDELKDMAQIYGDAGSYIHRFWANNTKPEVKEWSEEEAP